MDSDYKFESFRCPGLYCGRMPIASTQNYSACGACPAGFLSQNSMKKFDLKNTYSLCIRCDQPPTHHEWSYLFFICLVQLICQFVIIDRTVRRLRTLNSQLSRDAIILHLSAVLEVILAAVLTLACYSSPFASFHVVTCGSNRLSDWYTVFHNPPKPYNQLNCTGESVYPLYSIVFTHLFFSLLAVISIRPCFVRFTSDRNATKTIYLALYLIPTLAFFHFVGAGLIFFAHSYITLFGSLLSVAWHLAFRLNQQCSALVIDSLRNTRFACIIFGHWILHAYGLLSLSNFRLHPFLIPILVPLPSLFYVFTAKYTDPSNFGH